MRDARTGWTVWRSRHGRLIVLAGPDGQRRPVDVGFRRLRGNFILAAAALPDGAPWDGFPRASECIAPLTGWAIDCRHAPAVMEVLKLAVMGSATLRAVAKAQAGKLAKEIRDGERE